MTAIKRWWSGDPSGFLKVVALIVTIIVPLGTVVWYLAATLTTLQVAVSELNKTVNRVEDSLTREVAALRGTVGSLNGAVSSVENSLSGEVAALRGTVGSLNEAVSRAENTIDTLNESVGGLRTTVSTMTRVGGRVEDEVERVRDTVDDLDTKLDAIPLLVSCVIELHRPEPWIVNALADPNAERPPLPASCEQASR